MVIVVAWFMTVLKKQKFSVVFFLHLELPIFRYNWKCLNFIRNHGNMVLNSCTYGLGLNILLFFTKGYRSINTFIKAYPIPNMNYFYSKMTKIMYLHLNHSGIGISYVLKNGHACTLMGSLSI